MEFAGSFERFGSGEVIGWVAKLGSDDPITVSLWIDGERIGVYLANAFRHDLQNAGVGSGRHAFFIPVPKRFFDDRAHSFSIKIEAEGATLHFPDRIAAFRPDTVSPDRTKAAGFQLAQAC